MDDEWDLHAVVKSCTTVSGGSPATGKVTTVDDYDDGCYSLEALAAGNDGSLFLYPTIGENPSYISGGLEDVYKEGCSQPLTTAGATASAGAVGGGYVHEQLPMLKDSHSFYMHTMNSQSMRTRKRKNQEKKMVFNLTKEELSNDTWAWRKYGQKPIKGSPYPRNYYRCSTTKACGAKKQVERSPMDPNIFIVSYSGEHIHPRPTHRSSLAGSTRSNKFNTDNNKPPVSGNTAAAMLEHPPCSSSSPASASSFSPTTSFKEDDCEINDGDEYDNDIIIANAVMNEELLKRFRDLNDGGSGAGAGDGGCSL